MGEIIFTTTNQGKLDEAKRILKENIVGLGLEIDEIQSLDTQKVAIAKALAYFDKVKKPLFVEDVALTLDAWNGLPGTYINDFWRVLGNVGIISKMEGESNRRATAITTLAYIDSPGNVYIFEGIMPGRIAESVRGDNGFGWDPIFIPDGYTITLAEMTSGEKDKISMRAQALQKLYNWLQK